MSRHSSPGRPGGGVAITVACPSPITPCLFARRFSRPDAIGRNRPTPHCSDGKSSPGRERDLPHGAGSIVLARCLQGRVIFLIQHHLIGPSRLQGLNIISLLSSVCGVMGGRHPAIRPSPAGPREGLTGELAAVGPVVNRSQPQRPHQKPDLAAARSLVRGGPFRRSARALPRPAFAFSRPPSPRHRLAKGQRVIEPRVTPSSAGGTRG